MLLAGIQHIIADSLYMASVKKILEKHQAAKKTIVVEAQQPFEQTQAV